MEGSSFNFLVRKRGLYWFLSYFVIFFCAVWCFRAAYLVNHEL